MRCSIAVVGDLKEFGPEFKQSLRDVGQCSSWNSQQPSPPWFSRSHCQDDNNLITKTNEQHVVSFYTALKSRETAKPVKQGSRI